MWPFNLSVRLPIVGMVGRYLTIYLIGREAILKRIAPFPAAPCGAVGLCGISSRFQLLSPTPGQVPHVLLTRSPLSYPCVHPKASAEITPFDLHVLGAPPAFVLSQDQTLYKMVSKPDYSEFKSLHSQTQSLASCELLLEFLKCFPHSKRVLQVLLIVQFSRSSAPRRFREAAYLLYRIRCCLSTLFCDFFEAAFPVSGCSRCLPGGARQYYTSRKHKSQPLFAAF